MFGRKNRERIAKLEAALSQSKAETDALKETTNNLLKEHGKGLDKLRAAYMEMLTKTPSDEQIREDITTMLGDEDQLSYIWNDLSANGKRRLCEALLEFISTDTFMRDEFHSKMDEPIRYLMGDLADHLTEIPSSDEVEEIARSVLDDNFQDHFTEAFEDAKDEIISDLEPEALEDRYFESLQRSVKHQMAQWKTETIKREIREIAEQVLTSLSKTETQSREDAIKQVQREYGITQHFDGAKMRYYQRGRELAFKEVDYEQYVTSAMRNPRLRR